ncbi:hypothetical protein PLEOSDRAFT_1048725 [Pleurotus ostreatus PC15]|uniref:DUF6533 domain-containing protein n=1 Tax=Pleurotus ostreatus (strain PC15) TaxID=1137138 RepID=A0A067NAC0_PLEO1|nr:hypothetical protein PLEOSDRAFT_1048725 [Pleurotus ostreatus PC15]
MSDINRFIALYKGNLIPLTTVPSALTWILHDYFVTLEDEVCIGFRTQKWCTSKAMFLWIRYYSIVLLIFDVTQIHLFARPGITSDKVCLGMDPTIRVIGAVSLWSIEIIMQLRIYALYEGSKKVALFNFTLFLGSIAGFLWVLIYNAKLRPALIADAVHLPLPGCPSIHAGIEWAQWIPATAFEGVLFCFALYKGLQKSYWEARTQKRFSLYALLLRDNLLYFFAITCILIFNNLMVVGVTHIPWFSYGPFHAALEILTVRMLLNLRKATAHDLSSVHLTEVHVDQLKNVRRKDTAVPKRNLSALAFQRSEESETLNSAMSSVNTTMGR